MAAERFFLIIRAPNGEVREMPLGAAGLVLGRDESADIRVDDKKVSRRHATFKLDQGEPWVEDLGSSNGVRLNGKRIDKRARLTHSDKIRVGGFQISLKVAAELTGASVGQTARPEGASMPASVAGVSPTRAAPKVIEKAPQRPKEDLPQLTAMDPPVAGRVFVLHRGENIIGRLEECDVPILDGSVSRQHARLVFARDRVTATDLGSSNGIFVNGVRVDMAELAPGDTLKVGNIRFEVYLPAPLANKFSGPLKTRARPKVSDDSRKRWLILGMAGLLSAAGVVGGALYLRARGKTTKPPVGLLALNHPEAPFDAGLAQEPPADPNTPALVAPPPVKSPTAVPTAAPAAVPTPPPAAAPTPGPARVRQAAPQLAQGPNLGPTGTATSPFSRRDAQGLPLGLPPVDAHFNFDAAVLQKVAAGEACEQAKDYECLRATILELLGIDPINDRAKVWQRRAADFERAQAALAKADRLVAKGEFAKAYRTLSAISDEVPQAEEAKTRAQNIMQLTIEDELSRAEVEAKRSKTWRRAHARYLQVIELDPSSEPALNGIRRLERKMRGKQMEFPQYEPPARPGAAPGVSDMKAINDAIVAHYGGNRELAEVAQAYARGALAKARRKADTLARSGAKASRRRAGQMIELLDDVKTRYARTRTEISNDPDRAWSMLMQLERLERELLPKGVQSFLARELQVSLSEAFAERGASMFDRGRFEEAFQGWVSGYKLDTTNPKVRAGLARLERRAETLAQEAELAHQRGDPSTCDKWKQVTRITPAETDVHKKARERALALCR